MGVPETIAAARAPRMPYLDGWRGLAILMVLLAHFGGVRALGLLGVQLFFVLSGLLMSRVLFQQRMPLATFYRRRIARIFPVFYLYLGVTALWSLAMPSPATPAGSLGWSALFLRTYWPGGDIWADPLVGHLWSLNVEEHCYVGMSLIALLTAHRAPRWAVVGLGAAAALFLAGYALHRAWPQWAPTGSSAPFLRTEVAGFAILVAAALHTGLRTIRWRPDGIIFIAVGTVTLVAIAASIGMVLPSGGNALRYLIVPLLLAATVNLLPTAPSSVLALLSHPLLAWFGLRSFSLYLWHYPIWRLAAQEGSTALSMGCWFVLSVAIAVLSFHVVERPMRRLIAGPSATGDMP